MKKIVIILAAVLTLGISVNSYAAVVATAWKTNVGGTVSFPVPDSKVAFDIKPSANVYLGWGVNLSGTSYVLLSTHASGNFAYGTSSGDTNIFRVGITNAVTMSGTTGTLSTATLAAGALPGVPLVGAAADWTGWTAAK